MLSSHSGRHEKGKAMTQRVGRVISDIAISADGYSAGLNQTEDRPFGDDPPFHAPVFVLTHHPREPQPMDGGTTFYFVTDGIESALARACQAAGDGDVAIQGGATTINQYLAAGLIGELRLHIVPLTLGAGTRLFEGVPSLKLEQVESRAATSVTHVTYRVLS